MKGRPSRLMYRMMATGLDGVPFQAPPRDDRSHDRLQERTGIVYSIDGDRWYFNTVEERRRFVAEALDRARAAHAATSVIHTLRVER